MFYAWFGIACFMNGGTSNAYELLSLAKSIGEETSDNKVIGYACAWLTWASADLAFFEEAEAYYVVAQKIAEFFPSDQYLYFKSLGGLGWSYWLRGDIPKIKEVAIRLLDYGERYANSRSKVIGHFLNATAFVFSGDFLSATKSGQKSIEVCDDPLYSDFGRGITGCAHMISGFLLKKQGRF